MYVCYILSISDYSSLHQNKYIYCFLGEEIKNGEIRLVGGEYSWEGYVEIFLFGSWGRVSRDYAWHHDAEVVCRQFGYETYSKHKYTLYSDVMLNT